MMAYDSQSSRLSRCLVVGRLVGVVHVSRSFVKVDAVRLKEAPVARRAIWRRFGKERGAHDPTHSIK